MDICTFENVSFDWSKSLNIGQHIILMSVLIDTNDTTLLQGWLPLELN